MVKKAKESDDWNPRDAVLLVARPDCLSDRDLKRALKFARVLGRTMQREGHVVKGRGVPILTALAREVVEGGRADEVALNYWASVRVTARDPRALVLEEAARAERERARGAG